MSTAPASAISLPLSGRTGSGGEQGSVSTNQSTVNAGGGNSVNLINSSVSVQGPFQGSVPSGAASATPLRLTLDDALTRGLRSNLGTLSQSEAVLYAQGQQRVARSTLLPNLNSTVTETVEQLNLRTLGVSAPGIPPVVGPFNFFDARAARLNQAVFDLVRLRNQRVAQANVTAARQTARDARDLVVLAVAGSYLQLVASNARIIAAGAQVESAKAVYQQAADRLKEGLNARIDATRSRVQLQTEQQRLRSLIADRDRQKLSLSRLIGLPLGQEFDVTDDFPYQPLTSITLEEALSRAYRDRYDLKAAQSSVQAAEAAVQAAHAERLPALNLSADYGAAGLRPTASAHGTFNVTGTLTIPLYEGGRIAGEIVQARAVVRQRQSELADTRGRIDQDVRRAFIDLNAAADQVDVARSNVDLAQDALRQSRDRFIAGVADTVEVVQAEQAVVQADDDYIGAVFEHNLAKVTLARAVSGAEETLKQFLVKR